MMLASGWHAQLLMSFLKMTVKLFQFLRDHNVLPIPDFNKIADPKKRMAIEYSMPKWIIDHWATHYGLEGTHNVLPNDL
jgi:16S rRNA C967 or C1407 C5-methylase (RsmB/RsmF family)